MIQALIGGFTVLSVILLLLGFILIAVELMMPGFSMPGILGSICLIASVLITANSFIEAIVMSIGILIILGIMLVIILGLFAKGKIVGPLILTENQKKDKGYISSSDLEYLQGKVGKSLTDLRPSGIGDFNGVSFDVVSDGQYIVKDTEIVIVKVVGSKLIVKIKG